MKATEKLIINLVQCLIGNGDKLLTESIISEVVEAYIIIDRKFKFINKGLLHLI